MTHFIRITVLIALVFIVPMRAQYCHAQNLAKQVTIDFKKKPLGDVLTAIGKQGNFYFSYNSSMVHKDSTVTIMAHNKTVKQVLDMLFGENNEYKETENYIIIKPADKERWYVISGYVTDAVTGIKIPDVSVFERQQLVSTLTNQDGYFRLYIKDRERYASAAITVSKGGFYNDTNLILLKGYDHELTLSLTPANHTLPDIVITQYSDVERSWLGKLLFSSKLRKQSANLSKFFVDKPIQFSFTPGLGTHGKMSGQVTNKFSFNALGGYSAGVDGFEIGGLFNIDKKDVQYAQVGGIFNIVTGGVKGVQVGGIANTVSKSVSGVQLSGIASHVNDSVEGVVIAGICSSVGGSVMGLQLSGIANLIVNRDTGNAKTDTIPEAMRGAQVAGIANVTNGNTHGFQLAGIANINNGDVEGVQMSGIFNSAGKVTGSQISLVNIADTVTGYCFGIINIVRHGYHKIALSSNEVFNLNFSYKAGSSKLYSILSGGVDTKSTLAGYSIGYGIGKEIRLSKLLALPIELTAHHIYPSYKDDNPVIIRFSPSVLLRMTKGIGIFAGPVLSFCPAMQIKAADSYFHSVPEQAFYDFKTGGNTALWVGWQAGIQIL